MGSLAGVVRRRKGIDGAQRLAQLGQKSNVECKGKSQPYLDINKMYPNHESVA